MSDTTSLMRLQAHWSAGLVSMGISLFLMLLFCILGISGYWLGWIFAPLSAGALAIFLFKRLSQTSDLLLTQGGLTVNQFGGQQAYRWADITSFSVSGGIFGRYVVMTLNSTTSRNGSPTQGEVKLADSYGMGAESLAHVLDDWRRKFSDLSRRHPGRN